MPQSHERIQVIAVIPREDDPSQHLVDPEGNYPSVEHSGDQTYEATFREMGKEKLGVGVLSVARRLPELEDEDDIAYEAKPVSGTPHPDSGYSWKRVG